MQRKERERGVKCNNHTKVKLELNYDINENQQKFHIMNSIQNQNLKSKSETDDESAEVKTKPFTPKLNSSDLVPPGTIRERFSGSGDSVHGAVDGLQPVYQNQPTVRPSAVSPGTLKIKRVTQMLHHHRRVFSPSP